MTAAKLTRITVEREPGEGVGALSARVSRALREHGRRGSFDLDYGQASAKHGAITLPVRDGRGRTIALVRLVNPPPEATVEVSVRIPVRDHLALSDRAQAERRPMAAVIREAIGRLLSS